MPRLTIEEIEINPEAFCIERKLSDGVGIVHMHCPDGQTSRYLAGAWVFDNGEEIAIYMGSMN